MSTRIAREVRTPDVLINNAGAGRWISVIETTAEEALAMIAVPYLAAFNLTRAFLPTMLARRSGAIACITSPASFSSGRMRPPTPPRATRWPASPSRCAPT